MKRFLGFAMLGGVLALSLAGAGLSAKPLKGVWGTALDVQTVGDEVREGSLPINTSVVPTRKRSNAPSARMLRAASHGDPAVGDSHLWLGLDDAEGAYLLKFFTLRAIGTRAEVWVANDTDFLTGDCRNGARTTVTDTQVGYLLREFDTRIWPKEAAGFSIAPDRNGENEFITQLVPPDLAADMHPQGAGDRTVVLVDNVRDENYYDMNNASGSSYIAGFFSSSLNAYFDRNIMTIDAFDWLHRTGANPPNNPVAGDNCASAPARPFLYEGVFAHEYQHLLEHYESPDEVNWVNEGLSDWAQTLTGYVAPQKPITDVGFDSHIQCFLGWLSVETPANPNPRAACGPENSLTRWEDQGDGEVLADYGAAYSFMEFVQGRYGDDFMTNLHRNDLDGLAGLQSALDTVDVGRNDHDDDDDDDDRDSRRDDRRDGKRGEREGKLVAQDVLHEWSLMVALDGLFDRGYRLNGKGDEDDYRTPTLDATVNWDNPHAYASPGAPSNGADYVRLRTAAGQPLSGGQLDSLDFKGSTTLPSLPVQWTVDPAPPTRAAGNPALYSGADDLRDEAIVRSIAVPTGAAATLSFNAFWNEEDGWDFGFAQVSTDGGSTYASLTCTDTSTEHDPDALPTAVDNVPGYTGFSGAFKPQSCSLAAYAGQSVLLAFRAFNDPASLGSDQDTPVGFWVDDVKVGSTLVSDGSSLAGWKSFTETKANTVSGYTVNIVSINTAKKQVTIKPLRLNADFSVKGKAKVQKYVDKKADFVGVVVFYDDPAETSFQYAPYELKANGVTQAGGA
jgi:hypothetical protein